MAVVIPFLPRRPAAPQAAREMSVPRQPAAILFFTGVRYERAAEPPELERARRAAGPARGKGRRAAQRKPV